MKSSGSQIATKVVHALFSVLFLVVAPVAFGDAEDAARAFLKEKGLQEGYDAKRERFVLVGVSFRDVNDINAPDIFDLREQMVLEALDQAREDIIKSIDSELLEKVFGKYENELMNAAKIDEEGGVDVSFVPVRKINIDIRSQFLLLGCTLLRTEESYDEETKLYEVAVVVTWDTRREQSAANAIDGKGNIPSLDEDKSVWSTFVSRSDFSHRFGPLQFIDSNGNYHFVGVGFSDVDGKADDEREKAKDEARKSAEQSLACSLWSERVWFDCANRMLKDSKDVAWGSETFEDDFSAQVQTICHSKSIARHETLFEGNIVRPLTGRQTYVCVVGIPSVEVPKLGILKTTQQ